MKYSVKIAWGRDARPEPNPNRWRTIVSKHDTHEYNFPTKAELEAFLEGVSASSGWDEYTIISGDPVFIGEMDGLYDDLRPDPGVGADDEPEDAKK
jgi:hypothetical protein